MQYFLTAHKANSDHDSKAGPHSLFILLVLIQILQGKFPFATSIYSSCHQVDTPVCMGLRLALHSAW